MIRLFHIATCCILWNIGFAQWHQDFFVEDKQATLDTLRWAEEHQDTFLMGRAYFSLGHSFSNDGNDAMGNFTKAVQYAKASGDVLCEALVYHDIGYWYNNAADFARYEKYQRAALQKILIAQDSFYYGHIYSGLANVLWRQNKQLDSALFLYDKSIESYRQNKDTFGLIAVSIEKAETYRSQEDYPNAVKAITATLDLKKQQKDSLQLDWILHIAGAIYREKGDCKKAIEYLKEALEIAKALGYESKAIHEHLQSCYAQLGNYPKAHEHALKFKEFGDKEKDTYLNNELTEIREKFETERLEELNTTLAIENNLKAETNKRQRIIIINLVVGALAIMTLIGLLWFNNRRRQRAERALAQQHQELNEQRIKTLEQSAQLERTRAIVQTQEGERERVAKELHDSLGGILSTTKLYFDQLKIKDEQQQQKVASLLNDALKETRAIAYAILPKTLHKYGLIPALEGLANQINEAQQVQVIVQYFGKVPTLSEEQALMLYRIVQELLNNTIKHAQADEVLIQLTFENSSIELLFEDDGIGFDIETANYGMGIRNVQSRVEYLNGKLSIDSEVGVGTTFEMRFPAFR